MVTHVAEELVQGFHSSVGCPRDCLSVLRTLQLVSPSVSSSKERKNQVEAISFLPSSFGSCSIPPFLLIPLIRDELPSVVHIQEKGIALYFYVVPSFMYFLLMLFCDA